MSLLYQIAVLADTPALYLRLDMTGLASNGDSIPDISGHGLNGTLSFSGSSPVQPYGWPSPIETDPASREFNCNNNPFISAASISRASDPLIAPSGDLSLEVWLRPSTLAVAMITKLKIFDGICYEIGITTGGKFYFSVRDTGGTVWSVIAPGFGGGQNELLQGDSYHVVGVRVSNVIAIYVNKILQATTTIVSGLPTLNEAGAFQISAGISGNFAYRADEVAIYTYALTLTRIAAHYDAAKLAVELVGQSDGTSTAVLSSEITRQKVAFSFEHNIDYDIRETLSFQTPIITSRDVTEQRMGNRTYPRRTLEYVISPYGNSGKLRRLLQSTLFGGGLGFYKLPIFADESIITSITP